MPFNIISYKKSISKGIEGHLKGIVQKLEDSQTTVHYDYQLRLAFENIFTVFYVQDIFRLRKKFQGRVLNEYLGCLGSQTSLLLFSDVHVCCFLQVIAQSNPKVSWQTDGNFWEFQ